MHGITVCIDTFAAVSAEDVGAFGFRRGTKLSRSRTDAFAYRGRKRFDGAVLGRGILIILSAVEKARGERAVEERNQSSD